MKNNIKQKLNNSLAMKVLRENKDRAFSTLTDDLDSLIGCKYLWDKFSIPIGWFYNKRELYKSCLLSSQRNIPIFVDCDLHCGGLSIGNHYTPDKENMLAINPNMLLKHDGTREDYCSKYGGSTSAILYALDGMDDLEEEQLELLILLDGWDKQLYSKNKQFRESGQFFVNQLDMKSIENLRNKHDFEYWTELSRQFGTYEKIKVIPSDKGFFNLKWSNGINENLIKERFKFDISLPTNRFFLIETYTKHYDEDISVLNDIPREKVKSISETSYGKVRFSEVDSDGVFLKKANYERIYLPFLDDEDE